MKTTIHLTSILLLALRLALDSTYGGEQQPLRSINEKARMATHVYVVLKAVGVTADRITPGNANQIVEWDPARR